MLWRVDADTSFGFGLASQLSRRGRGIMSRDLWQKLPEGFLDMSYATWHRQSLDVQRTIVELAHSQNFKCALCRDTRPLVVDHDHEPEEGPGKPYTIYNIRGLVCQQCNWHLGFHEQEERGGGVFGWENVSCKISRKNMKTISTTTKFEWPL